jgi:hypothetical protein
VIVNRRGLQRGGCRLSEASDQPTMRRLQFGLFRRKSGGLTSGVVLKWLVGRTPWIEPAGGASGRIRSRPAVVNEQRGPLWRRLACVETSDQPAAPIPVSNHKGDQVETIQASSSAVRSYDSSGHDPQGILRTVQGRSTFCVEKRGCRASAGRTAGAVRPAIGCLAV